jgi:pimeloyl-ACP methyl ester carboxylesterase
VAVELSHVEVLAPDLLGFGDSPRPKGIDELWADFQAGALAETLDLESVSGVTVVGHDFGGPVSLALLASRPDLVSRLVLVSANAFPDTPVPFPLSAVTWPGLGRTSARVLFSRPSLRMMIRMGTRTTGARVDADSAVGDARQAAAIRTIFTTALRELRERYVPIHMALRDIEVPTMIVWGGRDPFFPASQGQATADAAGAGRFLIYEDAGHFVPEEQPERLARDIREFLG